MTCRNDLELERKVSLLKESEYVLSYRELEENFQVSLGTISNILKRKHGYVNGYECNHCKNFKPKMKNDLNQTINHNVCE